MTTRRGNGEGTVPKPHPSGGYYNQISLGGGRKSVYGKTPAEVRRNGAEMRRRFEDGQPVKDSRRKVSAWVERWETIKLPASDVRQGTADRYVRVIKVWVEPTLGNRSLGSILPSDCEDILLKMSAKGRRNNYRRLVHSAMTNLFAAAVREGLLKISPMATVPRPSPERSKAGALTPKQVEALMGALSRTPTLVDLVPFLALTGARRAEALGLRWADIDEEEGVINLTVQVTRDSSGLALRDLKTFAGARTLDLSPAIRAVLRQRRKRQMADRLAAPVGTWEETGLVFTTKMGGAIEPNNVNRAFREARRRAGLPTWVTPHTLRHTAVTLMLAAGVDEKVVAEVAGHSSSRITRDIYQHVLPRQRAAALDVLGKALGGGE